MRLRIAGFVTAAALAAAVLFTGEANAQGNPQGDAERFPAGPANMFRPGSVFTFYGNTSDLAKIEGMHAALNIVSAQNQQNSLMVANARRDITAGVAASSTDELAHAAANSIDGTFAIIVQAGFVRALAQKNGSFTNLLQNARTVVPLPGKTSIQVPALMAAAVHSLSMIKIGEKMRKSLTGRSLAGTYDMTVLGECGLADGEINVTQKDFVFEGMSEGNLVFYGTVGATKTYLVANERRYVKISDTGTGLPKIEVPDRPSDLFEAAHTDPGGSFAFQSITRGECALKLAPKV
jgi:hypothetical protein